MSVLKNSCGNTAFVTLNSYYYSVEAPWWSQEKWYDSEVNWNSQAADWQCMMLGLKLCINIRKQECAGNVKLQCTVDMTWTLTEIINLFSSASWADKVRLIFYFLKQNRLLNRINNVKLRLFLLASCPMSWMSMVRIS